MSEASQQEATGPLVGLKVLDIGTTIAGPLSATLMADFGADVIKIEHPTLGDSMRHWVPMKDANSLWWKVIGRNKRTMTLNLGHERGQQILKELVADADIVIENFRPGTMEGWNLGYSDLSAVNPGIILVRISGYGQTGPYAKRPGYGTIAEGITGIPSFTGHPDGPPTLAAIPLADTVAATFACFASMFAIYEREQNGTGQGQEIDISLFEPLFRLAESQVIAYDQLGLIKTRMGNRLAEEAPRNAYATADGRWITISCSTNRTFERLANAIGMPELPENPNFVTNDSRVQYADELDGVIASWFAELSGEEALRILEENDVVAGPILDIAEIVDDPQYLARESVISVEDYDFGRLRMQNVVPRFGRTPGRVAHAGKELGADTVDILKSRLSMSLDMIEGLRKDGVI